MKNLGIVAILTYLGLILGLIVGWVMNLFTVIHLALSDAPITTSFILRCIGVPVAIIGAIMGWF